MQAASEASVLGDFAGARFEKDGVATTFERRDGRWVVRTEGADGALHDYDVAYTLDGAGPHKRARRAATDRRRSNTSSADFGS